MFVSVQELKIHPVDFDVRFQPGQIDLGPELRQTQDLKSSGRIELLQEDRGGKDFLDDIRLVGSYSTEVQAECDRCLEPVLRKLSGTFDLLYRPLGADGGRSEISISAAETEIGYYQNGGMALEDVLKEQLMLARPVKLVCSDNCRGLCPVCGCNLNIEGCDCATAAGDTRWSALADLRDKLKQ